MFPSEYHRNQIFQALREHKSDILRTSFDHIKDNNKKFFATFYKESFSLLFHLLLQHFNCPTIQNKKNVWNYLSTLSVSGFDAHISFAAILIQRVFKETLNESPILIYFKEEIQSSLNQLENILLEFLKRDSVEAEGKYYDSKSLLPIDPKSPKTISQHLYDKHFVAQKQIYAYENIVGKSKEMQAVFQLIQKVASTDAKVLITGETGAGKELVAKAIHFNSSRKNAPFVGINCGAIPETLLESELFGYERGAFTGANRTKLGKFEYAQGGTVFLDEVGDISPMMQVKLLRVLQEKTFERVGGNCSISLDIRTISATTQDLRKKIKRGEFREELFYRLNVIHIRIPALRERKEDIPLLVNHFIQLFNGSFNKNIKGLSFKAMKQMMQYDWPGNVRELENVLERSFVISDGEIIDEVIFFQQDVHDIKQETEWDPMNLDIPFLVTRSMIVKRFETCYLQKSLQLNQGNVTKTAKQMGISIRTLWRKIKELGLDRESLN